MIRQATHRAPWILEGMIVGVAEVLHRLDVVDIPLLRTRERPRRVGNVTSRRLLVVHVPPYPLLVDLTDTGGASLLMVVVVHLPHLLLDLDTGLVPVLCGGTRGGGLYLRHRKAVITDGEKQRGGGGPLHHPHRGECLLGIAAININDDDTSFSVYYFVCSYLK